MSATVEDWLLDSTFAALADPTRRAILARLWQGDASVGELAQPFEFALPTISRHLKVLEQARLIEKRKDASRRHCRLRVEPLREASKWME
jgi:DNA-binding transcriptional ArsR family regulator